ncbi:MAG: tRNA epoxyqueuosine(34) reductase QueG [Gemmatimonadota bacterium]
MGKGGRTARTTDGYQPTVKEVTVTLTERLKAGALELGFDTVGIAAVSASHHDAFYREWIAAGRHGEMEYLARADAVERRVDPVSAWPELRSAIVVGLNYYIEDEGEGEGDGKGSRGRGGNGIGVIARYARGRDYHKVIKAKLLRLLGWLEQGLGRELPAARAYVDTGPVLERELAQRAGLGWFGRNTMLIDPRRGSYFFLGALLVEVELEYDQPFGEDRCGTCQACVDACPTGALLGRDHNGAPQIDATRCISYLTIEHRGPIPRDLRPLIGNRIFGCDICQEVCPWNSPKFVQITRETDFAARDQLAGGELLELMALDESQWDEFSHGSAIRRAKRSGFLRNVAIALGNWGSPSAVPVLVQSLTDAEALVRGHAAWALGRIPSSQSLDALRQRRPLESDPWVLEEIDLALAGRSSTTLR